MASFLLPNLKYFASKLSIRNILKWKFNEENVCSAPGPSRIPQDGVLLKALGDVPALRQSWVFSPGEGGSSTFHFSSPGVEPGQVQGDDDGGDNVGWR